MKCSSSPTNRPIHPQINQKTEFVFFQVLADWHQILLDELELKLAETRRTPFLLSFPCEDVGFDLVAVRNNSFDAAFPDRDQMKNDLIEVKKTCEPLQVRYRCFMVCAAGRKNLASARPFHRYNLMLFTLASY